jgi:hypothetical protein
MGTGYMIEEGKDKYPIIAGSGKNCRYSLQFCSS